MYYSYSLIIGNFRSIVVTTKLVIELIKTTQILKEKESEMRHVPYSHFSLLKEESFMS